MHGRCCVDRQRHTPLHRVCGRGTAHEVLVFITSRDADDFEVFSTAVTLYSVMARFGIRSRACVASERSLAVLLEASAIRGEERVTQR